MCPCDPVVLVSISSSSAELYFPSSIILSLFPIEHCSKEYLTSSYSLDEVSNIGMLLETLISCPSTNTSIRDCLRLALGLSGHSHQFLLLFIFSLEETTVR